MAELTKSSSSASSFGYSNFDVFLNFRGEDTRNNFTGFLHKALKNSGIDVFIDSETLWVGEAIGPTLLRGIEGSKISIPVFSKDYASSKWCLLELSQILNCHVFNGQMVLPIFLDIEPSHVRNQTGSFEEPFREHEKNFEPHIVKRWREALKMVGELKGWVLKEDANGNQAELVDLVVKRIWGEVIGSTHFVVCKYPIGIDSQVNDLVSLLNIGSNGVQFVGICGFGGIGKTTIAKALYNRIRSSFIRHCFISDVREQATQYMGLASLQKQLLQDIFKTDINIADYDKGKILIEERLCKEKVLLVLDDVDNQEQVDALASEFNWFGRGSRIIITTRDEHILDVAKVGEGKIYWPQVLDSMQSLQLFSLHAFSRDQPPEDYMQLSLDVIRYSGGLPLTIEVLGSYLSNVSNKQVWESTLQKLKEIPHEKVQRRLKISYDNLEDTYQRAIFLDAACFFIGWDEATVIFIWEACGYHPKTAINRLIKRSLLKFEDNRLRMHEQIRDMGRNIALEENLKNLGERIRLWSHGQILEVLEEYKGTDRVNGMMLPYDSQPFNLDKEHFEKMCNLRYLDISRANYMGDFSCLPSRLICFRWSGCPLDNILPTDFYLKRLVYLGLSKSKIKQAWNIGPQDENKRFQKLKVLDLGECHSLSESPNFSWFPSLELLEFGYCISLEKLDDSIGQLSQLKSLVLYMCQQMKELPKSIGDLKSLVSLDLSFLKEMQELPDSISQLNSLNHLYLRHCLSLKKLPESFGDLKSLVHLDLQFSTKVEELPDTISRLSFLKYLNLQSCLSLKKLPQSIGDLKSLVIFQLNDNPRIEELPDGVGLLEKLEVLIANDCCKLVELPRSMGRMKCLHSINLKRTQISKLPDDFSMLSNLQELKMSGRLQSLPADLSHLKNLRQLKLYSCDKLEYIPVLPSSLSVLYCKRCYSLVRLPDFSRLKNLTTLKFIGCKNLGEIRGLEGTESLEELNALGCYNLTYTPRKIHGQGTLVPYRSSGNTYSWTADDGKHYKGLILCIVLEFSSDFMYDLHLEQGLQLTFDFDISASIREKDKTISCLHTLRIEDVEITTCRHVISIHHFRGFDWFGIPLQGKDAIENLCVCGPEYLYISPYQSYYPLKNYSVVKLGEILFENMEPDQQKPNYQHLITTMVADFFNWSYFDDDGGVPSIRRSLTCSEAEVEEPNSVPTREKGVWIWASNYKGAFLDDEEEMISLVAATLKENGKTSPSDNMEEEEEERNKNNIRFLDCLGFILCFCNGGERGRDAEAK